MDSAEPAPGRKHAFHLSVVATLRDTDGLGHVNNAVYLGETVDLWCAPSRIGRTSWEMVYEGRARKDGRLVVEARSVQVQYDYRAKSSRPIPEEWRRMLEKDLIEGEVE